MATKATKKLTMKQILKTCVDIATKGILDDLAKGMEEIELGYVNGEGDLTITTGIRIRQDPKRAGILLTNWKTRWVNAEHKGNNTIAFDVEQRKLFE